MDRSRNRRFGIWGVWLAAMVLCSGSLLAVSASADGEQSASAESRVWTDSTGRFTVEAELVDVSGDRVTLTRVADGQRITLRIEQLSAVDQQHLLGEQRGKSPAPAKGSTAPRLALAPFGAAAARRHQEAWANHLGVQVEYENSIGMRFVLIPPGEFDMGSTEEEIARLLAEARVAKAPHWYIERLPAEAPRHLVQITKPFWLGCHEVTRGQFRQFVEDVGYRTDAERDGRGGYGTVDGQWKEDPRFVWNSNLGFEQTDKHPVVNVTWNDAIAFCDWLSKKEGKTYWLPTEAQWEYACRAGTTTLWYGTNHEVALQEYGWFRINAGGAPHPVGRKRHNAWGIYDMHGNVWEWCADWWDLTYYSNAPLKDPDGPATGTHRVARGGAWEHPRKSRSAVRNLHSPVCRFNFLGFRVSFNSVDHDVQ